MEALPRDHTVRRSHSCLKDSCGIHRYDGQYLVISRSALLLIARLLVSCQKFLLVRFDLTVDLASLNGIKAAVYTCHIAKNLLIQG